LQAAGTDKHSLEEAMKLTKHGLLAAVAATALVAGAGAFAQQSPSAPSSSEIQGGAKADAKAEKKTTTQAPMRDSGATAQGGAKVEGKTEAQAPTQPGTQTQKPGAKEPRGQVQQQQQDMKPGQAQQKPGAKEPSQAQQPGQAQPGAKQESGAKTDAKADAKSVELNSEQRTKVSQTIKQQTNLKRVSRSEVNFTINVGTVVPRTYGFVVLPAPIIAIVPQFRGYLYIVVDDQLLIIHPTTYEIVMVLPA
jgi:hypothetical protein